MIDSTRSIKACAAYYGENADEMEAYLLDGEKRALELGNRGPISFDENGVYESGWGYNEMKDHFEKIVLSKDIKEFFLPENKDI